MVGGPRRVLEERVGRLARAARTGALTALASVLGPSHHSGIVDKLLRRRAIIMRLSIAHGRSPSSKPRHFCTRRRRTSAACCSRSGSSASRWARSGPSTPKTLRVSAGCDAVPGARARRPRRRTPAYPSAIREVHSRAIMLRPWPRSARPTCPCRWKSGGGACAGAGAHWRRVSSRSPRRPPGSCARY